MLIDHGSGLSAAIAVQAAEIEGSDAMFAQSALKGGSTVQRFGCVISHIFIVCPSSVCNSGQWVRDFRVILVMWCLCVAHDEVPQRLKPLFS